VDLDVLQQAVRHVLEHHDALRLRFVREGSVWRQENVSLLPSALPIDLINLSEVPSEEQDRAFEIHATKLQTSFHLDQPPLLRVAWFDLGDRPGRLLVLGHRLVVDALSWSIVIQDLLSAYQQLKGGQPVQLPLQTTSFRRWAEQLAEHARSAELSQEMDYWLDVGRASVACVPVDHPGGQNTRDSADSLMVELNSKQTQALLQTVPQAYQVQVQDVLLTALVQGMERWTADRSLLLTLQGHGREEVFAGFNPSRTVGNLACSYPVLLELQDAVGSRQAVRTIREQLQRVPNGGIGYGLLRYLRNDPTVQKQLQTLSEPQVIFHYIDHTVTQRATAPVQGRQGQRRPQGRQQNAGTPLATNQRYGPTMSREGPRPALLEIQANASSGRLRVQWTWSSNLHDRSTIETVAQGFLQALETLIADSTSAPTVVTAADFPAARLSDSDLKKLLARMRQGSTRTSGEGERPGEGSSEEGPDRTLADSPLAE
jgi:non-ribosomal peptide synthase protein (TIGR01720 family)